MSGFSGFKNVTFKASVYSPSGVPCYKGRTICYEDGRRLWQETSKIVRMSRGDALKDAQNMAREYIIKNVEFGVTGDGKLVRVLPDGTLVV